MKIYSILLCKNESDIIEYVILDALKWSDKIFVFDNGSTDNTWNIVNKLAEKYKQVIPYIKDDQPFRIGLRSIIFEEVKSELTSDDWWCIRMDSDEFYIDNPKIFLKNIPKRYKQVSKASIDYYITKEDIVEFKYQNNFYFDKNLIHYYSPYTWSETRFIRHSNKLYWNVDMKKPQPVGMTYHKQIRVKHYQFRSPKQMKERYDIRQNAKSNGCGSFHHEKEGGWQNYLRSRSELEYDQFDGTFHLKGNRNKVYRWYQEIFKFIWTVFGYYG